MPLRATRGKTECPRRVSVSLTVGSIPTASTKKHWSQLCPSPCLSEVAFGVPEVPVHLQTKPELR